MRNGFIVSLFILDQVNEPGIHNELSGLLSGRSSRPWDKGGGGGAVTKKFFSALRATFWSKNKGEPGLPSPSPGSATGVDPAGRTM